MSAITQLTVVNACLKSMGETPLNELDADHPYVQAALNILSEVNSLEQEMGWWFNTDYVTLQPDPNTGYVYVPADTLNLELEDTYIVQHGNLLWDSINQTNRIGRPLRGRLIRELAFEKLPRNVQTMVSLRAQVDFQSAYDADENKYNKLYAAYQQAYNRVKRMHIRNQRINMLDAPGAQRVLMGIRPGTRFGRGIYPYRIR